MSYENENISDVHNYACIFLELWLGIFGKNKQCATPVKSVYFWGFIMITLFNICKILMLSKYIFSNFVKYINNSSRVFELKEFYVFQ